MREQLAFVLGFYFLEEEAKLPEEDTRNVHQFLTGYYYYKHIEVMSFAKYNY